MAFEPHSSLFNLQIDSLLFSAVRKVENLLGVNQFSPEETLAETKNIDPRFIPKAPMQSGDIDANLLVELGKMGMRRGKLISEESHPELMHSWKNMSARAGLKKPPQLIVVESNIVNAMTVTPEEVVVTTGLLKKLDFREVNAVLGHELAHANSEHKQPRIIAKLLFSTFGALAMHKAWMGRKVEVSDSKLAEMTDEVLAFAAGGSLGNMVGNQISVKPTELQADLKGAAISGDPMGLVSALRKLEAGHKRRPVFSFISELFSGYPSTEQRITNLETVAAHMPPVVLPAAIQVEAAAPSVAAAPGVKVSSVAADARVETATQAAALG